MIKKLVSLSHKKFVSLNNKNIYTFASKKDLYGNYSEF